MSSSRFLSRLVLVALSVTALVVADQTVAAADCKPGEQVRIWTSPQRPQPGAPLEIMAVATDGELDDLLLTDPGGRQISLRHTRNGGPPWSLYGTQFRPSAGVYRIEAMRNGRVAACHEVNIGGGGQSQGSGEWDLATQAFYAAWIEHLFNTPPEQSLSFDSLGPLLRDPERNFLFNTLGAGEDHRLQADPDCADLAYILRAYFAWKLGLPVAYRACSRGSRSSPPRCEAPVIDNRFTGTPVSAKTFRETSRQIMNIVHSGSGRTALNDESTDFYPVPLTREALWPGTLYADPYGHVMILVKWVPQQAGQPGMLLAVDAQPDNSVARKRFWQGTFLFANTPSAGPGFKAFRPLVGGRLLPNRALDGASGLPPYSTAQATLTPTDFYARMDQLINPQGLDPDMAYESTLAALMEQLETRVTSVDNGERYVRANPKARITMPTGPAIFETIGPWEDYATPSRDMRLLIAIKTLADLPERIRRYPELYVLRGDSPQNAAARIERLHQQRLDEQFVTYTRSDGSPWRLSLRDIMDNRRSQLEMAYNPNDCVERRWGASPETPDHATCRRQAPSDQHARMVEYRVWFRDTVRPPR